MVDYVQVCRELSGDGGGIFDARLEKVGEHYPVDGIWAQAHVSAERVSWSHYYETVRDLYYLY